ncbi:MAG TPA: ester cyclase [Solirubrobacteraceae bacterium]|nr:ester cyclase [Solirubrobacteraceae bacterium]
MASSSVIAKRYLEALARRDLDAAMALWEPGGEDRVVGQFSLTAPDGPRAYFEELFGAFPDFRFEVVDATTHREHCAVRWRASGTFVGPGRFQGFVPNGAQLTIEGCDVVRVVEDRIVHIDVYFDSADVARQLGVLPAADSAAGRRLTALANTRTRLGRWLHGAEPEAIAAGVWVLRGGRPRAMNVYLIEDEGGVTAYDAGIATMAGPIRAAAVRLGGLRRVVLGHADADHRGAAAALGAPVYCHPAERSAAQSPSPYRDYWNFDLLSGLARPLYPKLLSSWDGGALEVAGTLSEGDEVAGFRVIELPGHAPGLIGLFREDDRLALVSDCFYTLNPETGRKREAQVPHPAFNYDTEQARESIRRLASLRPAVAWPGHARPVAGDDVELQLQRAASAAV